LTPLFFLLVFNEKRPEIKMRLWTHLLFYLIYKYVFSYFVVYWVQVYYIPKIEYLATIYDPVWLFQVTAFLTTIFIVFPILILYKAILLSNTGYNDTRPWYNRLFKDYRKLEVPV